MNKREQAAFLLSRLAEATAPRKVGDLVSNYRGTANARIVEIRDSAVYLDNGDSLHISKVRNPL